VKYVPEWFPGAGFQKVAKELHRMSIMVKEVPYQYVKEAIVGDAACFRSEFL
jgi:hypothetical protein